MRIGPGSDTVRLALAGDVMTGRGIDQALAHPSDPTLYEPWIRDARAYVDLALERSGPFDLPICDADIWGAAIDAMDRHHPDARIVNLETSVTVSDDYWIEKGIHYRMHPDNIGCLSAAGIDCCVLANNHVMDFGHAGLEETLSTLTAANLPYAGAGRDRDEAAAPVVIEQNSSGRVLVFGCCDETCGVPIGWAAGADLPGVNLLRDLTGATVRRIADHIGHYRQDDDIVVLSIHWGGNWGYELPPEHVNFARGMIDTGLVHVIHGHSSHHPKGLEIYRDRLILYGCGDLLNDYEGITGHEAFRSDLSLLYLVDLDVETTREIRLVPLQIERFRLNDAANEDARWLARTLDCQSSTLEFEVGDNGDLTARW